MVKHIILFKLKDEVPEAGRLVVMNKFKEAIEALPAKISVIRGIKVGLSTNPGETWYIALYNEFDTLEDVKFCATHPDHVAAGKIIAKVEDSRVCVDYELQPLIMKMRKLISFLFLSLVACILQAQVKDPIKSKTELNSLSDIKTGTVFAAAIDKGWYVYSTDLGDGGPISAIFNVGKKSGVELVGKSKPVGKEVTTFDKLSEMKVRYFENTAEFVQRMKLTGRAYAMEGYLKYGACDDESCLPPIEVPFKFSGEAEVGTTAAPVAKADKSETKEAEEATAPTVSKNSAAMMELVPASATDVNADI